MSNVSMRDKYRSRKTSLGTYWSECVCCIIWAGHDEMSGWL